MAFILVCAGCGSGGSGEEVSDHPSRARSEDIARELDLDVLDDVPRPSTTVRTTTSFPSFTTLTVLVTTQLVPVVSTTTVAPTTTTTVDVPVPTTDDHPLVVDTTTTTTTTTTLPPTTISETPPDTDAPDAEERSGGVWDRLAECESGGNWQINTGNGYYGGLQFSKESWDGVGGSGHPHEHSREEQIHRAELLLDIQGWGAWPTCSRKLGLR